jgi:hypothetical protein
MSFQTAGLSPQSITEGNNLKTDSTICEDTPPTSVTETLVTPENPSKPVTGKKEGRKVSLIFRLIVND